MNEYQKEQFEAFKMVSLHVGSLSGHDRALLKEKATEYLRFRNETDSFLSRYFSGVCTEKCYKSKISACCSREGIIAFFADVVVNVLVSEPEEINCLMKALKRSNEGFKCIYLGENGCLWRVKPIVCEMFICDRAKDEIFAEHSGAGKAWENFRAREKSFKWPDRPVLFDDLERYFIDAGCNSPLMYLHNSPGLLRLKQNSPLYPDG